MASNADIYVAFGADTGGLEAALAVTKVNVQALTREMTALAREMQKTGATDDTIARMKGLGAQLDAAKTQARSISGELGGVAQALHATGDAAAHGHTGLGFYVRETHALMDEIGSGRTRQAVGTFSNLIMTTLQSNLTLIPYAAAIAAVGGAFGYLAYQAYTANAAMKGVETEAAINQFQVSDDSAKKFIATIKELANVSNSDAEAIFKPFAALGPYAGLVSEYASTFLPQMVTGEKKLGEVSAEVAKYFLDLEGAGRKYVDGSRSATEETRRQYDAFVAAGEKNKAYKILLDLLGDTLRKNANDHALARAKVEDHSQALVKAGTSAGTLTVAEADTGEAVDAATRKIEVQTARLGALSGQLLSTADAAVRFRDNMAAALKVDKVAEDIHRLEDEVAGFKNRIAAAPDKSSADVVEMTRAMAISADKLKEAHQQFDAGVGGGDLVASMKGQLEQVDATWKGSESARLQAHLDAINKMLAGDQITETQRRQLTTESYQVEKQIRDAGNDSYLRQQEIQIAAAGKDSARKIAILEAEVKREADLYGEGSKQQEAALDRLARAKEEAANRGAKAGALAAKDELAAAEGGYQGQIRAAQDAAKSKIQIATDEFKLKQIPEAQKVSAINGALAEETAAVKTAFDKEIALAGQKQAKIFELQNQQRHELASIVDQQVKDEFDAAQQTQKAWADAASQIESAWNSQLRGLLAGTTSWQQAMKSIAADLVLKMIEDAEKAVVQWVIGEALKTQATIAGTAARTGAEGAGAAAGAAVQAPSILASILASAGEAFAGVFGFLAPIMGPAAAGPAGGAYASVAAMAGSVASADIGMWDVPRDQLALVHHNELIMPAGPAGALREMLSSSGQGGGGNVSVNPQTHLHVNAIDGASVSNWMRNNAGAMAKHIHQASREGALLGLRGLRR